MGSTGFFGACVCMSRVNDDIESKVRNTDHRFSLLIRRYPAPSAQCEKPYSACKQSDVLSMNIHIAQPLHYVD